MTNHKSYSRRHFVGDLGTLAGGALLFSPLTSLAKKKETAVGDVMDRFIGEVAGSPFPNTVDTLKSGSRDTVVKGIVTTMFATVPVINQAIRAGANFIIAHEPTFYNHLDQTDWLEKNEVFQYKKQLLDKNGIAVWRNHDYIHSHKPDGVFSGVLDKLGWKKYVTDQNPWNVNLPQTTMGALVKELKQKLAIQQVRVIGEPDQPCSKILLMPGAAGGQRQIAAIAQYLPDVAIVGELQEWETAEFVRDARASGKKMSLIVLGHTDSEDAGSIYMKDWLTEKFPTLKTTYIYSGNPFTFL